MDMNSLSHTKWECKYHLVFALKYRRGLHRRLLDKGREGFKRQQNKTYFS